MRDTSLIYALAKMLNARSLIKGPVLNQLTCGQKARHVCRSPYTYRFVDIMHSNDTKLNCLQKLYCLQ